jgi:hypothetical protein
MASLVRSSVEQVLSDVDLVGLILSKLIHDGGGREARRLATWAAHSLCLASQFVRAAKLAAVQRARMYEPQPAVLQQMASLVQPARRSWAPGPPPAVAAHPPAGRWDQQPAGSGGHRAAHQAAGAAAAL